MDRGKEFACFEQVETEFGIPMYFADTYAAWQRGSNENSNGLLREFFPKKTDLAKVTLDKLTEALVLINKVHWYGLLYQRKGPSGPFFLIKYRKIAIS